MFLEHCSLNTPEERVDCQILGLPNCTYLLESRAKDKILGSADVFDSFLSSLGDQFAWKLERSEPLCIGLLC